MAIAVYQDLQGRQYWADSTSKNTRENLADGSWVLYDDTPGSPPPAPADPFDSEMAERIDNPASASSVRLRAALVPFWSPAEAVAQDAVRMTALGLTIKRNTAGTTRATYDATESALWTVTSGSGGGGGATYTDEQVRDVIGTALVAGTGITKTVNDAGDTITLAATGSGGGVAGVYDPAAYGAAYDGVTDDSAAIQAAIDAAAATGGGTVWITATSAVGDTTGRVRINTTLRLKEGVCLRGHGPATTLTGAANPLIALPTSGAVPDRVTISDLFLQSPAGVGIKFDVTGLTGGFQLGWGRYTVENVTVADAVGDAFQLILSGVIEFRLINCVSLRAGGHGFFIGDTDNFLVACTAAGGANAAKDGIHLEGGNNHLTACKAYGNAGTGFSVGGAGRHMLSSCESQDNAGSGFLLSGYWNTLAACLADSNAPTAASTAGFTVNGGNNVISGGSAMYGGGGSGQETLVGYRVTGDYNRIDGVTNSIVPTDDDGTGNAISVTAQPRTPSAPLGLGAPSTTDTTVNLSWAAPSYAGATAISDYEIEYREVGAPTWTAWAHSASTATTATITGLTAGADYQFRVAAVNAQGTGPWSNTATAGTSGGIGSFTDDFNRADGPVGNGWTAPALANIASNRLAWNNGGSADVYRDLGSADGTIEIVTHFGTDGVATEFYLAPMIVVRYVDASNHILIGDGKRLQVVEAGVETVITNTANPAGASPWTVRVVMAGTSISVYNDNVLMCAATVTAHQTATTHGIHFPNNAAGNGVDSFQFTP